MKSDGPLFTPKAKALGDGERRIGKSSPPPPHKPTTAVPPGLLQSIDTATMRACRAKAKRYVASLKKLIGEPFYTRDGFILYNRDCRDILRALSERDLGVDLTVTSPPYNIGKEYERTLSLDEYLDWCTEWLQQIHTVTTAHGALWLNLGYVQVAGKGRAVPLPYLLWNKTEFFLQQEVVWHYEAGVAAKKSFSPRNEKWLFFSKQAKRYTFNLDDVRDPNVKYPNQKKNGKYRCNPLGKNPGDVWCIPKVTTGRNRSSKERTSHPAQFPLAVVDRVVKVSSSYCDAVLDPFSGSASAGVAAVGNGRVFIGVELREDYCYEAASRHERFVQITGDSKFQMDLKFL